MIIKFFKRRIYFLSLLVLVPVNLIAMQQQQQSQSPLKQTPEQLAGNRTKNFAAGLGVLGLTAAGLKYFVPTIHNVWQNYADQHPIAHMLTIPGVVFLGGVGLTLDYQKALNRAYAQQNKPGNAVPDVIAKGLEYSATGAFFVTPLLQQIAQRGLGNIYTDLRHYFAEHPRAKWVAGGSAVLLGLAAWYAWKNREQEIQLRKLNGEYYLGSQKLNLGKPISYVSLSPCRNFITVIFIEGDNQSLTVYKIGNNSFEEKVTGIIPMNRAIEDILAEKIGTQEGKITIIWKNDLDENHVIEYPIKDSIELWQCNAIVDGHGVGFEQTRQIVDIKRILDTNKLRVPNN